MRGLPREVTRRGARGWFRRMMALAGFRKYEDFCDAFERANHYRDPETGKDVRLTLSPSTISNWWYNRRATGQAITPLPEYRRGIVRTFHAAANRIEQERPDAAAELRKIDEEMVARLFGLIPEKKQEGAEEKLSAEEQQLLEHLRAIEQYDQDAARRIRKRLAEIRAAFDAKKKGNDDCPKAAGGLVNPALS